MKNKATHATLIVFYLLIMGAFLIISKGNLMLLAVLLVLAGHNYKMMYGMFDKILSEQQ